MKISVNDSSQPPEKKPESHSSVPNVLDLDDKWFDRDKLVAELEPLVDPAKEHIEKTKIFDAIRRGMVVDEEEEPPSGPVILEDTPAMQELDKILSEHKSASQPPSKPIDNSNPQ